MKGLKRIFLGHPVVVKLLPRLKTKQAEKLKSREMKEGGMKNDQG